jgi:cell division protein FtsL
VSQRVGMFGLILALALACGLYALKDQVQRLELTLLSVREAVLAEQMALERLQTEWATLNQPSRLARLAQEHLGLVPVEPNQIMAITDIPLRSQMLLSSRSWQTELASGSTVTLRFKPQSSAALAQVISAAGGRAAGGTE